MADLIRTIESDLFGAHEWAVDLYGDLAEAPEPSERLAAQRGLLRAFEALGRADDAMRAADGLVAAEEALDDRERADLGALDAARDALFADPTPEAARAFVDPFLASWRRQQHLLSDAVLAALACGNVLASRGRGRLPDAEVRALHAQAAQLYEEVFALATFRVGTGSLLWKETAQSAAFRAAAAWRLAGEEARARRATEIAGKPPGAEELENRGLRKPR